MDFQNPIEVQFCTVARSLIMSFHSTKLLLGLRVVMRLLHFVNNSIMMPIFSEVYTLLRKDDFLNAVLKI
jgi:hypothetical protein